MHIDGEFFKLKNPDVVSIQLAKECISDGKLRILERKRKGNRKFINEL